MSTIEPRTKFAEITDKWGRFRSIAIISPDAPTVSAGEDGFLWLDTSPDAPVLKVWDEDASAWLVVGTEASEVSIKELGDATFDNMQDWVNNTQASGYISGGAITDGGNGTIDVAGLSGFIKTTDSEIGEMLAFDLAETIGLELADASTNYIYVDYNDGVPKVAATTTRSDIEINRQFPLGQVYRDGSTLHIIRSGIQLPNFLREEHERIMAVRGFEQASGGTISEVGERYLESTAGVFYLGRNRVTTTGVDTSGAATFIRHYHSGGSWTSDTQSQICAAAYQYDNGTDLANIANNRYGVFWIFICFDSDLHVVVGRGSYKLAEAQAATLPTTPSRVSDFTILAAKVIIAQGGTNFFSVQCAFDIQFPPSAAVNHNDLGSIQGGAADDYYHMTQAQHTAATRDATNVQNGLMPTAKLDNWDAAFTHVSSDGSDHSFIDQSVVSGASPTFDGTNFTGIPISTGVSGLAASVATFLATPSSANLIAAVTDETGTGALVFADTPTLVTPEIGAATGTSLVLTGNLTASGGGVIAGAAAQVGTVEIYDGSDHKVTVTSPGLAADWTLTLPVDNGDANEVLTTDGAGVTSWTAAGTGDVTAAAALTDNLIVRGDVAAKAVQTSGITIDDSDNVSGMGTLGCGAITSSGALDIGAHTFTVNAIEVVGADGEVNAAAIEDLGANPSQDIGLSVVNGAATTYLRSDAAPALSQAIAPTWTGKHTFDRTLGITDELKGVEFVFDNTGTAGGTVDQYGVHTLFTNVLDDDGQTVRFAATYSKFYQAGAHDVTIGRGLYAYSHWASAGSVGTLAGVFSHVHMSAGETTDARGVEGYIEAAAGAIGTAYGLKSLISHTEGSGTIGTAYGLHVQIENVVPTTSYGVYIGNVSGTTEYGIYQSDASNLNYFAGNVGIGIVPVQRLHVAAAGTAYVHVTNDTTGHLATDGGDFGFFHDLNRLTIKNRESGGHIEITPTGAGCIGMGGETNPQAKVDILQTVDDAGIPVLELDQDDESEGFINFVGADVGTPEDANHGVRVELNGVVKYLALYDNLA